MTKTEYKQKLKSARLSNEWLLNHEDNPDKKRELKYISDTLKELENKPSKVFFDMEIKNG